MNILWTQKAEKQLTQIHEFIAEDSPYYAAQTVDQIVLRADSISRFPNKGRKVPEISDDSIREVFQHPYRIIYQIKEPNILILSILHQARNLK